jgi:hypothetical protein
MGRLKRCTPPAPAVRRQAISDFLAAACSRDPIAVPPRRDFRRNTPSVRERCFAAGIISKMYPEGNRVVFEKCNEL